MNRALVANLPHPIASALLSFLDEELSRAAVDEMVKAVLAIHQGAKAHRRWDGCIFNMPEDVTTLHCFTDRTFKNSAF